MQTIPTIINMGKVSTYLCANDTANGSLFGARLDPNLFRLIYIEMRSLAWAYSQSPTYTNIEAVANYNVALYGKYGIKAISILDGGGGGSVAPVSPTTSPDRLDFYVSSVTPIATGVSQVFFNSGARDFRGYNLSFERGGIGQAMVTDGFGSYFTWNRVTGEFNCFGAAVEDELFSIIPS